MESTRQRSAIPDHRQAISSTQTGLRKIHIQQRFRRENSCTPTVLDTTRLNPPFCKFHQNGNESHRAWRPPLSACGLLSRAKGSAVGMRNDTRSRKRDPPSTQVTHSQLPPGDIAQTLAATLDTKVAASREQ